jgi:hypothetical protein
MVVFCVATPDRIYTSTSGFERITFTFALDFSEDAYLTATGNRPLRCIDGTTYLQCSIATPGHYCELDAFDEYELKYDCRGFDKSDPTDDCDCGLNWQCNKATGECESLM